MCFFRFILINYGGILITCACFASVNCGPQTAVARVVGDYSGHPQWKSTFFWNIRRQTWSKFAADNQYRSINNYDLGWSTSWISVNYNTSKSLFLSLLLQSLNHPLILLSLTQQLQPSIHQRRYCVENEDPELKIVRSRVVSYTPLVSRSR